MSGLASDPVAILEGALRIYSPTGKEARLTAYLTTRMRQLGYRKVRIDGAGNAVGETGAGGLKVLLCGHMDTVPGRLPVTRTKEKVTGRGAADAKSALCALLLAGSKASDAEVSVTFVGATQEEGNSEGVQEVIRGGRHYDCAVFGEPSGANRLAVGYRGRFAMRLAMETEGGHAASPWAFASAFDEFQAVLAAFRKYERERSLAGDHFRSLSVTPTLVEAGNYQNVIPPRCSATFDVRLPPGAAASEVKKDLARLVAEAKRATTRASVEFDEATDAYEVDPNSSLVRAFQRAIILKLKDRPVFVRKTSTGDMNTFASATGASCVTYGPADSGLSHTDSEEVSVKDYLDSIEVLTEALRQLARLNRSR